MVAGGGVKFQNFRSATSKFGIIRALTTSSFADFPQEGRPAARITHFFSTTRLIGDVLSLCFQVVLFRPEKFPNVPIVHFFRFSTQLSFPLPYHFPWECNLGRTSWSFTQGIEQQSPPASATATVASSPRSLAFPSNFFKLPSPCRSGRSRAELSGTSTQMVYDGTLAFVVVPRSW
jgi:hypothetical protein